jgi:uncharacterized protein (TIGR02145 family)
MSKILWIFCLLAVSISVNCQNLTGEQSGTFKDQRDGHEYKWVNIGKQIWMSENLAYLPTINGFSQTSDSEPCYYVYEYEGTNVPEAKRTEKFNQYGVLYNWEAAKSACPEGWHLPGNDEWNLLAQYISSQTTRDKQNSSGNWPEVGKYLKAKSEWHNKGNGTDDFGFSALAGGARNLEGYFFLADTDGSWWSSTGTNRNEALFRYILYFENELYQLSDRKSYGFSVRCVKD